MTVKYEYIHRYGDNLHRITVLDEEANGLPTVKVASDADTNFARLYSRIWKDIPKKARPAIQKAAELKLQFLTISGKGETLKKFK